MPFERKAMRRLTSLATLIVTLCLLCAVTLSQQSTSTTSAAVSDNVPRLIPFNGTALDAAGRPIAHATGVTFALYKEQQGGAPLWIEVQNVQPDAHGKYSAQLGSSKNEGLPAELFTSGDARWLGVQPEGQQELPRILLLSVPYALKAKDSDTLGGLPPSAYALAQPQGTKGAQASGSATGTAAKSSGTFNTATGKLKAPVPGAIGGGGIAGYIPLWSDPSTLTNSSFYQGTLTTTGNVGLKTQYTYADFTLNGSQGFLSSPATMFYMNASPTKGSHFYSRMVLAFSPSSPDYGIFWNQKAFRMDWRDGLGREFLSADFLNKRLGVGPGTTAPAATLDVAGTAGNADHPAMDTLIGDPGCGPGFSGLEFGYFLGNCQYSLMGDSNSNTYVNGSAVNLTNGSLPVATFFPEINGFDGSGLGTYSVFGSENYGPGKNSSIAVAYKYAEYPNSYKEIDVTDSSCGENFVGFSFFNSPQNNNVEYCFQSALLADTSNGETILNGNLPGPYGPALSFRMGNTEVMNLGNYVTLGGAGPTVNVFGTLTKQGGSFKIDHPLDPANKYLYHSFVESPDMMNIYNGNVTTDSTGLATVTMPDWFEALNRDFRYQLTVIGQFAQAIVGRKMSDSKFTIKTDKPNVEVSWQVTGVRQDAWANAHRIPTEETKDAVERGHYLHPELFGQPEEASIQWAHEPDMMRRTKEGRSRPATPRRVPLRRNLPQGPHPQPVAEVKP